MFQTPFGGDRLRNEMHVQAIPAKLCCVSNPFRGRQAAQPLVIAAAVTLFLTFQTPFGGDRLRNAIKEEVYRKIELCFKPLSGETGCATR